MGSSTAQDAVGFVAVRALARQRSTIFFEHRSLLAWGKLGAAPLYGRFELVVPFGKAQSVADPGGRAVTV